MCIYVNCSMLPLELVAGKWLSIRRRRGTSTKMPERKKKRCRDLQRLRMVWRWISLLKSNDVLDSKRPEILVGFDFAWGCPCVENLQLHLTSLDLVCLRHFVVRSDWGLASCHIGWEDYLSQFPVVSVDGALNPEAIDCWVPLGSLSHYFTLVSCIQALQCGSYIFVRTGWSAPAPTLPEVGNVFNCQQAETNTSTIQEKNVSITTQ